MNTYQIFFIFKRMNIKNEDFKIVYSLFWTSDPTAKLSVFFLVISNDHIQWVLIISENTYFKTLVH